MNTQNILKFYGSKLDIKLDSSEFYDYEVSKVQGDYNTDVLDLTTPITYTGLTIDAGLGYASCSRNTITLSEYDNSINDPDYVYSGMSFTLDYDNFISYFGDPYQHTILNNHIYTYTGSTGEIHYFKIVGFNNPLNTDIILLPGTEPIIQCSTGITENCPIFWSNDWLSNIFYYNPNNIQGFKYLSTLTDNPIIPRCVNAGIAMNNNKIFIVDVCGNYLEYDYTIGSEGCLTTEYVRTFRLFDDFTSSVDASYGIGLYDENTLLVHNRGGVGTTGSTIYKCDLVTLNLTEWINLPHYIEYSTGIYHNQTNGQTVILLKVIGNQFIVELYNGSLNPQKVGEIPCSMSLNGIVFSGSTTIGVNSSALRYVLDFNNQTQTLIEDSDGIPIKLYNLYNNQESVSSIFQNSSCYNFDYVDIIPFGLGREYIPDIRDYEFLISNYIETNNINNNNSLIRNWDDSSWWGNQERTHMCVGYAWAHWIEDSPIVHISETKPIISPELIYNEAKKLDFTPGENYNGTSVRAGARYLKSRNVISSYWWAFDIDTLIYTILNIGPVVVGTVWYRDMFYPNNEGLISVGGGIVSGHAYVINGIDVNLKRFRIKNSWGRGWGINGNAYISFSDMEILMEQGGEICLAIENEF